jgi:glutamate-ammonia-ligase adenylyltransferase
MPVTKPKQPAWPPPADEQAAARLAEAFAALGRQEQKFARTEAGARLLAALGGNAPYLADLAVKESACVLAVMKRGPDAAFADIMATIGKIAPYEKRPEVARKLRLAKRRAALVIALADLGGMWHLPRITAALSALAEAAIVVAVRHLLLALHDAGRIKLPHPRQPDRDCGFVALGLGKLGAGELNYSSDIDLVLLFDSQSPAYSAEAQPAMARFSRELVTLLSHRDEHGYVFRVDLRLRPDPGATPPVISLATALLYYESHGRTWERAAFSKARPVAGDIALGARFLEAIRPFIWRRHLDFAAIADIHDMKRRIDAGDRRGVGGAAAPKNNYHELLGFDVKLGRGGIREIEFIVQTLSLVWGGQDSSLRIPATLAALPALVRTGHLPDAVARALAADYRQLRKVEHRLQMIADRQTHELPDTPEALRNFTIFLDQPRFARDFPKLLARVHGHFSRFFDAGTAPEQRIALDAGLDGPPPPAFAAHLTDLGFTDIRHVCERLRAWSSGLMPALRSDRARDLLRVLTPNLLTALGGQPDPDRAFIRFDTLLSRQSAGVQLLSLLQRNGGLLDRLAAVLGAAPALAEHLAQDPAALEALLVPAARFAAPNPVLRRMLREAADLEQAVTITRRFVRREDFHLSVATLEGRLDTDEAGRLRSNLAQAALGALLPRVIAAHESRYGKIRGAAFAVVALGKAGGGEMLAGSDLDLLLMYDHAPASTAPVPYFIRLAQAFNATLTAQGPEGPLYKVDMRLRPSGNQGPVAVSRAAFRRYHGTESWTWERLALTRARVLAATAGFRPAVAEEICATLSRLDAPPKIRADAVAMRDRVAHDIKPGGLFDVKYRLGGMIELAFIPEVLQLIHGPADPALFRPNTAESLRALGEAGHLPADHADALIAADFLWRTVQGIARITGLPERGSEPPPPAMLAPLLRATGQPDLPALLAAMDQAAQTVRECFKLYVGESPQ